jgi:hypothetical protein
LVAYLAAKGGAALADSWAVVWNWAREDGWQSWFDETLSSGEDTENEERGNVGFSRGAESKAPEKLFVKSCT